MGNSSNNQKNLYDLNSISKDFPISNKSSARVINFSDPYSNSKIVKQNFSKSTSSNKTRTGLKLKI